MFSDQIPKLQISRATTHHPQPTQHSTQYTQYPQPLDDSDRRYCSILPPLMSSPGGPRRSSSRGSSPFFSACTGKSLEPKMPVLPGKSPAPGQQTVCAKCNRNFRRSPTAKPNSEEFLRCAQCRHFDVGEWLQESCVIS